jgi:ribonuclease J
MWKSMTAQPDAGTLRLIPLGGLGEFGLNAMVLDWNGHILLLDAGLSFPGAELPGVDSIVPDFQYLAERRAQVHGILLTHGHDDHIGALSFALQAAPAPVFGSRLTLGLARRRLRPGASDADMRVLTPGLVTEIGPFRVHAIRVAHSILDSLALAIETPAGTVLASGDFKIDAQAPPDERTDCEALAEWGRRGVRVLLSDSTNIERTGSGASEDDVRPAFEELLSRARGRVLVSCFATSFPRIQRVAELALRHDRALAFVGRRMQDNAEVALELGLLRVSRAQIVSAATAASLPPERVLLFVSGSQGEPLSALATIARGDHSLLGVGPGDSVVLSARVIPGNERVVSRLMSNLYRRGCDVVHPGTARVHVSGHGHQDDLLALLRLINPAYLVPVHGEYRMLAQHAALATRAGLARDRVQLIEDGDVLAFDTTGVRREARVAAGRVLLDRSGQDGLEDVVVRDRRHLSSDGIVVPVVVLDKQTGRIESAPEIVTRGFVTGDERAGLIEEASRLLVTAVEARTAEERSDPALTRERVRLELRRFLRKRTQRRPMVIPVVMEV